MTILELDPVDYYCPHCDSAMEWTACNAPLCAGYQCLGCRFGCDLYRNRDDGDCVTALATASCAQAAEIYELRAWRYSRPRKEVALPGECS